MELFTVLEQKLEKVLSQFEGMKQANDILQKSLAAKEQTLKEAEAALAKVSKEREEIRQRIDSILSRLEVLDMGEKR
jgi:septal ring factor EnvC (AmiA/AmiB activator)